MCCSPMTQLFYKRENIIFLEPLGEFLDLMVKSIIILEMWYDRVTYPQLRKLAQEAYYDYEPDAVMIEKKASSQSLLQDFTNGKDPKLLSICLIEQRSTNTCKQCIIWKMEEFTFLLTKNGAKI